MIGDCLRRVRLAQGRTLRDVSDSAGVSIGHLSAIERGTAEASSEVLQAICRALGLDLAELLEAALHLLRYARRPRASHSRLLVRHRHEVELAA